jgi:hypothetical protein
MCGQNLEFWNITTSGEAGIAQYSDWLRAGRPDWPWGPPSLLYNRYRVFLGVKRPGRDADHPPPSSAEVKRV